MMSEQDQRCADGVTACENCRIEAVLWNDPGRKCSGPATDGGCADPRAYTDAIGQAGEDYLKRFPHAHPLPAQWRWSELWDRMNAAAGGVKGLRDGR